MEKNELRGIGIGLTLLFESQIYPFMLSSAFTARTIVHEKNQVDDVKTDINISIGLSIIFSIIMGAFFKDYVVAIVGSVFAFVLAYIYEIRGMLI